MLNSASSNGAVAAPTIVGRGAEAPIDMRCQPAPIGRNRSFRRAVDVVQFWLVIERMSSDVARQIVGAAVTPVVANGRRASRVLPLLRALRELRADGRQAVAGATDRLVAAGVGVVDGEGRHVGHE